MCTWSIHYLNARGQLADVQNTLGTALKIAEQQCNDVCEPIALDLTVQASNGNIPPELCVCGRAYEPGRIDLQIDESHTLSAQDLHNAILRSVFHEFHHVLRWDGPGYGRTLGEALVSEGLAQVFVHEMMDCPPEPWEQAVISDQLAPLWQKAQSELGSAKYDHSEWFFGTGQLPHWAGYSLGFDLVSRYLSAAPSRTALGEALRPAEEMLRPFVDADANAAAT